MFLNTITTLRIMIFLGLFNAVISEKTAKYGALYFLIYATL